MPSAASRLFSMSVWELVCWQLPRPNVLRFPACSECLSRCFVMFAASHLFNDVFSVMCVLAASRLYVLTLCVLMSLRVFSSSPNVCAAAPDTRDDGELPRKALPWQVRCGQGLIGRGGGPGDQENCD